MTMCVSKQKQQQVQHVVVFGEAELAMPWAPQEWVEIPQIPYQFLSHQFHGKKGVPRADEWSEDS